MAGLIWQLFQFDQRADQTALRLFQKACRRTERRAKSDPRLLTHGKLILDGDAIAPELERLLRRELIRVNLIDPKSYQAVLAAINAWQPRYDGQKQGVELQRCSAVQNGLLALLPQLKRWQQLNQLCQDYQQHLVSQVAPLISWNQPPALSVQTTAVTSRPLTQMMPATRDYPPLVEMHQDSDLGKITRKLTAVAAMQRTLHTRQDVADQCQSFQTVFQQNRSVIEKDRDTAAITFVKAVVTVLSLGLAAVFGIWSVKGQKAAQQIESVLNTQASPAMSSD